MTKSLFEEAEYELINNQELRGALKLFGQLWRSGYMPTEAEFVRFDSWKLALGRPPSIKDRKKKVVETYRGRRVQLKAEGKKELAKDSEAWTAEQCGEAPGDVAKWVHDANR